jgi:hypothetical protein
MKTGDRVIRIDINEIYIKDGHFRGMRIGETDTIISFQKSSSGTMTATLANFGSGHSLKSLEVELNLQSVIAQIVSELRER